MLFEAPPKESSKDVIPYCSVEIVGYFMSTFVTELYNCAQ